MLRGFATIDYWTDDIEAAKQWYAELLAVEPFSSAQGRMAASAMSSSRIGTTRPSWAWSIATGHRPVRRRGQMGDHDWHVEDLATTFESC